MESTTESAGKRTKISLWILLNSGQSSRTASLAALSRMPSTILGASTTASASFWLHITRCSNSTSRLCLLSAYDTCVKLLMHFSEATSSCLARCNWFPAPMPGQQAPLFASCLQGSSLRQYLSNPAGKCLPFRKTTLVLKDLLPGQE